MIPTKFRQVTDKAAESKNIDKELLNDMGMFLFSQLKSKLNSFENLAFNFEGLGSFFYRKNKLKMEKGKFEALIANPEKERFTKTPLEEKTDKLNKINRLLELYDVYIEEKQSLRKKRYESLL